jgi:hypothetical protein
VALLALNQDDNDNVKAFLPTYTKAFSRQTVALLALKQDDGVNVKAFVSTYRKVFYRDKTSGKERARTAEQPYGCEQVSPVSITPLPPSRSGMLIS